MKFENVEPISLLNFLDISFDLKHLDSKAKLVSKKYILPSLSKYQSEDEFAQAYGAWDNKNLYFHFLIKHPFTKSVYPEVRRGDSIELFLDTKNLKTKGYITKYCHQFVFFPEEVQSIQVKEITRFRMDDMHKLQDCKNFNVISKINKDSYFLEIEMPLSSLFGFDIQNAKVLGFTYRINRYIEPSQHFAISSNEYVIERNPYLWATMNLIE